MPAAPAHSAAAQSNESLANHLLTTEGANWALVPAFYAALHWIDAYFAVRLNHHPADHLRRERLVAVTRELDSVAARYLALRRSADRVRYNLAVLPEADRLSLIQEDLRRIRDLVEPWVTLPTGPETTDPAR